MFWARINQNQRKIVKKVLATYRRAPLDVFDILRKNVYLSIFRIFLEAWELEKVLQVSSGLYWRGAIQAELVLLKRFNTVLSDHYHSFTFSRGMGGHS